MEPGGESTCKLWASIRSGIGQSKIWPARSSRSKMKRSQKLCASHPDRFVGLASVSLQFPQLAADQLEQGMKKAGHARLLDRRKRQRRRNSPLQNFIHSGRGPSKLQAIRLHSSSAVSPRAESRLQGNGFLVERNRPAARNDGRTLPPDFSRGTLDRFPKLKICAAPRRGIPAVIQRPDGCLLDRLSGKPVKPVKKEPSEYLKQLLF